ncbi:MAG: hypothetical protein L0L31_09335, partial [Corynebacterium casei]
STLNPKRNPTPEQASKSVNNYVDTSRKGLSYPQAAPLRAEKACFRTPLWGGEAGFELLKAQF